MPLNRKIIITVAALVAAACAPAEETRRTWDPYAGEPAYPNRRPKITLPAGEVGLVSNSLSDTLTFVALPEARVIATVPIGRDPVDIDGPHHLAVDRAQGFAVTALSFPPPTTAPGPHASHGTSDRFGWVQKLALDDLRLLGEVRVDPNPGDVVLSDDGKRLVVTHYDVKRGLAGKTLEEQRANVMLIDPATLALTGSPDPKSARVCVAPHGIGLSPGDGRYAYVACYGEDALAIVDLAAPDLASGIERIPLAGGTTVPGTAMLGPYSAVLSPSGGVVAMGCLLSKEVRLFDTATKAFRATAVTTQGAALFPAWSTDEKTLYVPVQTPDAVVAIDAASGAAVKQHALGGDCVAPHEIVRARDGASLYVVCEGDHTGPGAIVVLDPATLDVKARAEVGTFPDRVAVFAGAP